LFAETNAHEELEELKKLREKVRISRRNPEFVEYIRVDERQCE